MDILKKNSFIVSSQALKGEPLYGGNTVLKMAKAAIIGGADGIRTSQIDNIETILKEIETPVIGIIKKDYPNSLVYITPTINELESLINTGVQIIALDATKRKRPKESLEEMVKWFFKNKKTHQKLMADCATLDDMLYAEQLGFDYIGTTLMGYTDESLGTSILDNDFEIIRTLKTKVSIPIIAEGHISTPEEAARAFEAGADHIVVGSAITRPRTITARFRKALKERKKEKRHLGDYDSVIIGGGTAGFALAYKLSKKNYKVAIIEKSNMLGGTQTGSLVNPLMPSLLKSDDERQSSLTKNIAKALKDFKVGNGEKNFSPTLAKIAYSSMLRNIDVYFDCTLNKVYKTKGSISSIDIEHLGDIYEINSKNYVDASGNGVLAIKSGIERLSTDHSQPISLRFEMTNIDINKFKKLLKDRKAPQEEIDDTYAAWTHDKEWPLSDIFKRGIEEKLLPSNFEYFQMFSVPYQEKTLAFNCPEIMFERFNPKDYGNKIKILYEKIDKISQFLTKRMPGFEEAYISQIAPQTGIRESNRFKGKYVLTYHDVIEKKKFEDGVSKTNWYLDVHGLSKEELDKIVSNKNNDDYYEIPFRVMVNDQIKNMAVLGRCVSVDFFAQSSMRVQHVMHDLAEALSMAIDISLKENKPLNLIDGKKIKKEMKI